MPVAKATICWVPKEEGGRKAPPTGPRYITVVRFDEDDKWPSETWSLVVDFSEQSQTGCVTANIRFLVEEAPTHLLHTGSHFRLLEGSHVVAKGEVLSLAYTELANIS